MEAVQIPDPCNLPLLVHDPRSRAREALATVLSGSLDSATQIDTLSRYFKIKVWFVKPLFFHVLRHWKVTGKKTDDRGSDWISKELIRGTTTDCHVFSCIRIQSGEILYTTARKPGARRQTAYYFPIEHVVKWEPLPNPGWRY